MRFIIRGSLLHPEKPELAIGDSHTELIHNRPYGNFGYSHILGYLPAHGTGQVTVFQRGFDRGFQPGECFGRKIGGIISQLYS